MFVCVVSSFLCKFDLPIDRIVLYSSHLPHFTRSSMNFVKIQESKPL
jgi:hypothetical protein